LIGGTGNDFLVGVSHADAGKGDIDYLTSSSYGDRDTFVLGRSGRVYYDGGATGSDYAVIQDFDLKNFASETDFDRIQLAKGHNYKLGSVGKDTYIYKDNLFSSDELIGIVKNVQGLNLADSNQFVYS
ncbi:hemolysin, partial [filamentous cyanobacterium CCP5]